MQTIRTTQIEAEMRKWKEWRLALRLAMLTNTDHPVLARRSHLQATRDVQLHCVCKYINNVMHSEAADLEIYG